MKSRLMSRIVLVSTALFAANTAVAQTTPSYYTLRTIPWDTGVPFSAPDQGRFGLEHPYFTKCWSSGATDVSDDGTLTFNFIGTGYYTTEPEPNRDWVLQASSTFAPQKPCSAAFCTQNPTHACCTQTWSEWSYRSRVCGISEDGKILVGDENFNGKRYATVWDLTGGTHSRILSELDVEGSLLGATEIPDADAYMTYGYRDNRAYGRPFSFGPPPTTPILHSSVPLSMALSASMRSSLLGTLEGTWAMPPGNSQDYFGFLWAGMWTDDIGYTNKPGATHGMAGDSTSWSVGCIVRQGYPTAALNRSFNYLGPSCAFDGNKHAFVVGVDGDILSGLGNSSAFIKYMYRDAAEFLSLNDHWDGIPATNIADLPGMATYNIEAANAISNRGHIAITLTKGTLLTAGVLTPTAIPIDVEPKQLNVHQGDIFEIEVTLDQVPPIGNGPNGPYGLKPFTAGSHFRVVEGEEFINPSTSQIMKFEVLGPPDMDELDAPINRKLRIALNGVEVVVDLVVMGPMRPEVCNDGIDNDWDELIDCEDPDCLWEPCMDGLGYCIQGQCVQYEAICSDGIDNDDDGFTDCSDLDCDGRFCSEEYSALCLWGECTPYELECSNGEDDDLDGFIDCDDTDCLFELCDPDNPGAICLSGQCVVFELDCDDGIDNDYDGLVDCQDPDCSGSPCAPGMLCRSGQCVAPETDCANGLDDDLDGDADCLDLDCDGRSCGPGAEICIDKQCVIPPEICDDGIDNDGDGLEDCADPDCDAQQCHPGGGKCDYEKGKCVEVGAHCLDKIDNDGDELIDCEDPDCRFQLCEFDLGTGTLKFCTPEGQCQ